MQVNKEAVRVLVQSVGYTEAANQTGIDRNTLYQWNRRYAWNVPVQHSQEASVRTVRSAGDAHAQILADRKQRSAAHLSKYVEDASEKLANSQGDLKHSRPGKDIVAMRSGIWPEQQGQAQFSLNVLNLGGSVQIGVARQDGDSVG